MNMEYARQKAALAWTTEETKHIEMDVFLAEAFANIMADEHNDTMRLVNNLKNAIYQHGDQMKYLKELDDIYLGEDKNEEEED